MLLWFSLQSVCAFASPEQTLHYVKSLVQSRIEYHERLSAFFLSQETPQTEKIETYFQLTGIQYESWSEEAVDARLKLVVENLQTESAPYQNLLAEENRDYSNRLWHQYAGKMEEALKSTPYFQTPIELELEKMYLTIWTLLQNHRILRAQNTKRLGNGRIYSHQDETGYAELPLLKHILKLLSNETPPWWGSFMENVEFANGDKKVGVIDGWSIFDSQCEINFSGYRRLLKSIDEKRKQLDKATEENLALIEKYMRQTDLSLTDKVTEAFFGTNLLVNHMSHRVYTKFVNSYIQLEKKQDQVSSKLREARDSKEPNQKSIDILAQTEWILSKDIWMGLAIQGYPFLLEYNSLLDMLIANFSIIKSYAKTLPAKAPPPARSSRKERLKLQPQTANPETMAEGSPALQTGVLPLPKEDGAIEPPLTPETLQSVPSDNSELSESLEDLPGMDISHEEPEDTTDVAVFSHADQVSMQDSQQEKELSPFFKELKDKFSHKGMGDEFKRFFDDRENHAYFSYADMNRFITAVGGRIYQNKSSHCRIVVPGGVSFSWRPHGSGSGHSEKLSRTCVQGFREAFEKAGITPLNLGLQ